jgi:mRNA interferase MazF
MRPGDVLLTPLPQADGRTKPRPALVLAVLPPFGDALACGITTQLHHEVTGFDDLISQVDPDFPDSGLKAPSLVRLGYTTVLMSQDVIRTIGSILKGRLKKLLTRFGQHFLDLANDLP